MTNEITNEELARLKALAEAATPGPWEIEDLEVSDEPNPRCHVSAVDSYAMRIAVQANHVYPGRKPVVGGPKWNDLADAAICDGKYIAAASPAAILALIAKVESLAADAERLDFMTNNDAFIYWKRRDDTILQCQLWNQDEDEEFHILSGDDRYFNTTREAIDAAMAKEKA